MSYVVRARQMPQTSSHSAGTHEPIGILQTALDETDRLRVVLLRRKLRCEVRRHASRLSRVRLRRLLETLHILAGTESTPSQSIDVDVVLTAGDFDGDGFVGFEDFFLFVDALGRRAGEPAFDARIDLDADGQVGLEDFFLFAELFGKRYGSARRVPTQPALMLPGVVLTSEAPSTANSTAYRVIMEWPVPSTSFALDLRFDPDAVRFAGTDDSDILTLTADDGRLLMAGRTDVLRPTAMHFETWPGARLGAIRIVQARGTAIDGRRWAASQVSELHLQPSRVALLTNLPNPFNPSTSLRFQLPTAAKVRLSIYDAIGQRVVTLLNGEEYAAGFHQMTWHGQNQAGRPVGSGVYFLVLDAAGRHEVGKLLLLR